MVAMNMVMMRPREILWVIAVTADAAVMVVAAAVVVLITNCMGRSTACSNTLADQQYEALISRTNEHLMHFNNLTENRHMVGGG
jgi:hypothetical protein